MSKELCFSLIACSAEESVTNILGKNAFTRDESNWIPLGKNKNNAAIVQNTAGNLGSCLTELTTNAIDAVIQREKNNLESLGKEIPSEHLSSPEKFLAFALSDIYTSKDSTKLNEYSKDKIKLLTTETPDGKRSLTVVDRGCGQQAKNFGDTFCSVGSGHQNKANKSWLHGNYGQGSTSGNAISGSKGYKLVISRENQDQKWGFTIIRRCPNDPSMLEYLVVDGGESVLEFSAPSIELGIRVNGKIANGDATMTLGSAIKLYSVKFEKGFVGVKRTLGGVFFRPALPINSLEYSESNEKGGKKNGRDTRWIFGLGKYLDDLNNTGKAELSEFGLYCPQFKGTAHIRIYFVRSNEEVKQVLDWLPSSYLERNKRFFHINNGQAQHTDPFQKLGRFYPKSAEHIFIEIDLSDFDANQAKAYLWKADRTSFQTSTDHFQLYDKALENYLSNCEELKSWEKICCEDEMSKVKTAKNAKGDNVLNSVFSQFNRRESKQQKATKKLIQTEINQLGTHAMGVPTIVSEEPKENENKVEIEGKEIPTFISSDHSTRSYAQKGNKKNLSGRLKTDAKKGSVGSKTGNNNLKIKSAFYVRNEKEVSIDIMNLNLTVNQGKNSNDIKFSVNAMEELQEELKIGDFLMVEFEMTNSQNESHVLDSVVYFELIDELKEVAPKKARKNNLSELISKGYATKDGRKWENDETTNLVELNEDININKVGYYIVSSDDELTILMNLDNTELRLNMDRYKNEDKVSYMQNWEASLILNVINEYEISVERGEASLHDLANKLNNPENADLANRNAIHSAMRVVAQEEMVMKKSLKVA